MPVQDACLSEFLHRLRQSANNDLPVAIFLRDIVNLLLDFITCDAVEIWVERGDRCIRCEAKRQPEGHFHMESVAGDKKKSSILLAGLRRNRATERICQLVIEKHSVNPFDLPDANGFFSPSLEDTYRQLSAGAPTKCPATNKAERGALAVLPLSTTGAIFGLVILRNPRNLFRSDKVREMLGQVAATVAYTLSSQFAHSALHERVKELTCLYQLSLLTENPETSLDEILYGIVRLLPAAWQYPENASARIELDGNYYATDDFQVASAATQTAAIVVNGLQRGLVQVSYLTPCFELDEGPFLSEERALIDAVSRQLAQIVEQRQAATERMRLQNQLQHADRLATIGQLAAGVAHELNEPLGNILAFAQLAEKQESLPRLVADDLGKIVKASLHAREIIKKLMLFARQTPPQKRLTDLNKLVEEGLYFLESRCLRNGIEIQRQLSQKLPKVRVDPGQLNQVLVNLIVNAIQAMPHGGVLKISTRQSIKGVSLSIEDTGSGMTSEVLDKIFVPFFTTKDVNQGTGLGLPVAHGIVAAHGGRIEVRSCPDSGSRFEVFLPKPRRSVRRS